MFRRPRMRTYTMLRQMHQNNAHTMIHKITHNIKLFQLTHNTYTMPTCTHKNMIMDVLLFFFHFSSFFLSLAFSIFSRLTSPPPKLEPPGRADNTGSGPDFTFQDCLEKPSALQFSEPGLWTILMGLSWRVKANLNKRRLSPLPSCRARHAL